MQVSSRDYKEFTGRIGSGLCYVRCTICGERAKWPTEQIEHAPPCFVNLIEEIESQTSETSP